jgi:chaperonin GroEL (HSP60 family)
MPARRLLFHDNARAKIRRGVDTLAARTSEKAGDGTTTATVLAHAMIDEGMRHLAGGMNAMDIQRGMAQAVDAVVEAARLLTADCMIANAPPPRPAAGAAGAAAALPAF